MKAQNKKLFFWTGDIKIKDYLTGFSKGGFYNGRRYWEFQKEDEFMSFLLKIKGSIFFHHLHFDAKTIANWLKKKEIKFTTPPIMSEGKVIEWKINDAILRDSSALMQSELKELAKSFHLRKQEETLKGSIITLHNILKSFYDFVGNNNFGKRTIASISLAKFKEVDNPSYDNIIDFSLLKDEENFVRKGFFSAFYHIFNHKIDEKEMGLVQKIDCNSFYGEMMRGNLFPYGNIKRITKNYKIEEELKKGKLGMIRATAFCDKKLPMGFLPYKTKQGIDYPLGKKFKSIWTTPEIEFARGLGYKIKFNKEALFWEHKDYLFKKYINYLAKIKEKAEGAKREIAKMLLVSFFGKFGQRRTQEVFIRVKKPIINKLYLDKEMTMTTESKYMRYPYSHTEISAFTTSYSRIFTWKFLENVGFQNVLAVIMDSVILKGDLSPQLKKRWFDEKKVGKFKIVGNISQAIFLGQGVYALKLTDGTEIIKNQGSPKEISELKTFADFENISKNTEKTRKKYGKNR